MGIGSNWSEVMGNACVRREAFISGGGAVPMVVSQRSIETRTVTSVLSPVLDSIDESELISPPVQSRTCLQQLGGLLLQPLHFPLVLAGVEGGGRGRARALAVGAGADRLHRVEVLRAGAAAAQVGARVPAERPHHALAAAVGALRRHPHRLRLPEDLERERGEGGGGVEEGVGRGA